MGVIGVNETVPMGWFGKFEFLCYHKTNNHMCKFYGIARPIISTHPVHSEQNTFLRTAGEWCARSGIFFIKLICFAETVPMRYCTHMGRFGKCEFLWYHKTINHMKSWSQLLKIPYTSLAYAIS